MCFVVLKDFIFWFDNFLKGQILFLFFLKNRLHHGRTCAISSLMGGGSAKMEVFFKVKNEEN